LAGEFQSASDKSGMNRKEARKTLSKGGETSYGRGRRRIEVVEKYFSNGKKM